MRHMIKLLRYPVLLVEAKKQLTAQLDSHIPQVAAQCLATYVLIALQQITPNLAS